ncbi:MAG: [NiFe]-hydrogenase assembly chaperone HybE [Porticoccus sp.]|nr:[NiFe]-hydrogenase assembly chaperone HybE [Porticoccus sp.]
MMTSINTTSELQSDKQPKEIAEAVSRLEHCFHQVHQQRMQGIPILNNALQVCGVGFHPWQGFWLGVLITPWFINLVLLPATKATASLPGIGKKLTLAFPAGNFTFIAAHEEDIGAFLSCSLISPVTEITDQELAQQIAHETLLTIMDKKHSDNSDNISTKEIERIWRGEQLVEPGELSRLSTSAVATPEEKTSSPSEKPAAPKQETELDSPSRRALFSHIAPDLTPKTKIANDGEPS